MPNDTAAQVNAVHPQSRAHLIILSIDASSL
jgi:hypothetical protein